MPRSNPHEDRLQEAMRLRRLRASLSLSQRDLATEFNVARGAISFWESGQRTIPGPILKLIEIYENELDLPSSDGPESETDPSFRTSWISRNLKVAAIAPKLATQLVHLSLAHESSREEVARVLADSLGDLKGLCTKAGQMLSYVNIGLGNEVMKQFASLQDQIPPLPFSQIKKVVEEDFGKKIETLFLEIEKTPLATGSIGQVHWAKLHDGSEVAVKIQYPDIAKAIEIDLKNLRALSLASVFIYGEKNRLEILDELRRRFLDECDYKREADHQEFMRESFKDRPQVLIPRVYREFSTGRVLTSEYLPGKSFDEFLATSTPAEKSRAGEIIFSTAIESIFKYGCLNADPHPGNYLFRDDKIVFLDFGCFKKFTYSFVNEWKEFAIAIENEDRAEVERLSVRMGYVGKPRGFDFDYHYSMMRNLYKPWLLDEEFQFTEKFVLDTWNRMVRDNPNRSKLYLPKEWVFVNRFQWGLFSVLSQLQAKSHWKKLFLPILSHH